MANGNLKESKYPLVTIGIPSYNYGRYLRFCLESVLSQTYPNVQVIVLDDYSSDGTSEVVKKYGKRIQYVRHKKNWGQIATYNHAIKLARGKYFSLLSADDGLMPKCIEKAVEVLESHLEIALVYTTVKVINEENKVLRILGREKESYIGDPDDFKDLLLGWNFIPTPGVVMRKKIFREVGDYDPKFNHPADWDMWLRVSTKYLLAFNKGPLAYYRLHRLNMHKRMDRTGLGMQEIVKLYGKWLDGQFVDPRLKGIRRVAYANLYLNFVGRLAYNGEYYRALESLEKAFLVRPEGLLFSRFPRVMLGLFSLIGRDILRDFFRHSPGVSSLRG